MEILLALLIFFNLVLIGLVLLLEFKVRQVVHALRILKTDRRLKTRAVRELEAKAEAEIGKVTAAYSQAVENQLKKHFVALEALSGKKSKELADFSLEQQKSIISQIEYLVANNLLKVEQELSVYKQKKLAKIDGQVREVIAEVARRVLGKSIDPSSHQEMVMEALEAAKKEQFFD